jgi:hypothetical protein
LLLARKADKFAQEIFEYQRELERWQGLLLGSDQ